MLDNIIILFLVVGAFICGLRLSSYYHENAAEHEKYMLQQQYARLKADVDADDVMQPYVAPPVKHPFVIPPEFVDNLRRRRAATMRVDKTNLQKPGASAGKIL